MSELVQIVTIKSKEKLFKNGEEATNIELITFEENGFEVVSQKGLYDIDDLAVYIQPDSCIPNNDLFKSFVEPNGDISKSKLGKIEGTPARVRAIKFNFTKENSIDKVFSNGILLPCSEVINFIIKSSDSLSADIENYNLEKELGIYKYEEPEVFDKGFRGGKTLGFPTGIYKTDEENINNVWDKIQFPIELVGTVKADGSSCTIGLTKKDGGFICSRNLRLPLEITEKVGTRKKTLLEKLMFWKKVDLNIYENKPNTSNAFVTIGLPYLETLMSEDLEGFVLRGELCGEGVSKGSGNKNNKNTKEKPNIKFFGIDRIDSNGIARKMEYVKYRATVDTYKFPKVEEVFNRTFNSKEELVKECEDYFKNNLVEGIVVRTLDSTFSAKYMNNEYDSKK